MSSTVLASPTRRTAPGGTAYGFGQVVRAEAIKLSTLRSTMWTLLVTLIGSIGVTVLATSSQAHHPRGWYQGFDPTNQSLTGGLIAVLAIGVLGSLAATGEYSTGTIRSTLSAAPRRPLLLLGKIFVVGILAIAVGEVITFSCFGVGQAVFHSGTAPVASLLQHGVFRAVALSGVFIGLLGLLALGLGIIVRHTAGAIGAYVAVTFLIPLLLSQVGNDSARYTPIPMLANSVSAVLRQERSPGPLESMVLMTVYAAIALAVAGVMLVRRDA